MVTYKNNIPLCQEFFSERNSIIVFDDVYFPLKLDQKNDKRSDNLKLIFSVIK